MIIDDWFAVVVIGYTLGSIFMVMHLSLKLKRLERQKGEIQK